MTTDRNLEHHLDHNLRQNPHSELGVKRPRIARPFYPRTVPKTDSPEREPGSGAFAPAYRAVTIALVGLVSVVAFEALAISTAMPAAAEELDAVRSYGLAFSVMLTAQLLGIVLAGVWSARSGPMPALVAGTLGFAAGAAICGMSTTFPILLLGRAVTGLGSGLVVVVTYVVVGRVYPATVRPQVFVWISAAWVLPSLIGAPVSGWLSATFTWRLVFWIVVPPALVALGIIVSQAPSISRTPDGHDVSESVPNRATAGRIAVAGALVAVSAGLVQLGTYDTVVLVSWSTLAALVGLVGLALTVPRLMPAGTVRMARGLPSVMVSRFALCAAFNGAITFVPLMFTLERGQSLAVAGVVLAVGSLGWSFGSWIQGRSFVIGRRWVLVSVGGLLVCAGLLVMVAVTATGWSVWFFVLASVLAGLGMGLGATSLSVILLDLVPIADQSQASSSLQLADVLGSVLGIAAASALFAASHTEGGSDRHTYVVIWSVLAALAAVAILSGRRCRGSATGSPAPSPAQDVAGR